MAFEKQKGHKHYIQGKGASVASVLSFHIPLALHAAFQSYRRSSLRSVQVVFPGKALPIRLMLGSCVTDTGFVCTQNEASNHRYFTEALLSAYF